MLSLAQGACGIAGGVLATIINKCVNRQMRINPYQELIPLSDSVADFKILTPVATSWLSLAVFTDGQ